MAKIETISELLPQAIEVAKYYTNDYRIGALQLTLHIGYTKATKLTELMEQLNILSPLDSKTLKRTVDHDVIKKYEQDGYPDLELLEVQE